MSSSGSRIRQFGLYRTIDARTEEFLRSSRKRQIRQGCACAAISTAITVTVVVVSDKFLFLEILFFFVLLVSTYALRLFYVIMIMYLILQKSYYGLLGIKPFLFYSIHARVFLLCAK